MHVILMVLLASVLVVSCRPVGDAPYFDAERAERTLAPEELVVRGADAARGPELIRAYGCGACHVIPGVRNATGQVGPPLDGFRNRGVIAGHLPNTGENLTRWIRAPQEVIPGSAMPDLGVTEQEARDIAAYLLTLR